jgi:L-lactate dehydrogenase complex protein LldG
MSGRDVVLGKVRRALGASGNDVMRRRDVAERLSQHRANLIPARGQLDAEGRVALFCKMAEKVSATVRRLAGPAEVPAAIAEHLRRHNLPQQVRTGTDPLLEALPWEREPHLERRFGPSDGHDAVSLSCAFAGVAETGTLVLVSGSENPTTLNFLPDTHIVVVQEADIAGDYETVWQRLREIYGPGALPRTVNFITGPSRSADIEQTLILGAHGPRALHILVVGSA